MHTFSETGAGVPAFLAKLWRLVEDPETNNLICWSKDGRSFIIQNQAQFARELLPLNYKHNNMASFIRQLNMYGFHKITSIDNGGLKFDRDEMEFTHPCFKRNCPYLLEHIKRKIASTKSVDEKSALKPEAVTKVLQDVKAMRGRQDSLDSRFSVMKQENEALWREIASLRQKHAKQQQIVNKLIQFLITIVQPQRNMTSVKRHMQLMINDIPDKSKLRKNSESESDGGPVIHELGEELLDEVADVEPELMVPNSPFARVATPATPSTDPDVAHSPHNIERPHSSGSMISQNYDFSNQSAEDTGYLSPAATAATAAANDGLVHTINNDGSKIFYHITEVPDAQPQEANISPVSYNEDNVLTTPMVREEMARNQLLKQKNRQRRIKNEYEVENNTKASGTSGSKVQRLASQSQASPKHQQQQQQQLAQQIPQPIQIKSEQDAALDPMLFLNIYPENRGLTPDPNLISPNFSEDSRQSNSNTTGSFLINTPTSSANTASSAENALLAGNSSDLYNPNSFITNDIPADIFEDNSLISAGENSNIGGNDNFKQALQQQFGRSTVNSGKFSTYGSTTGNCSSQPSTSAAAAAAAISSTNSSHNNNNNESNSQKSADSSKDGNDSNMAITKYKNNQDVMRLSTANEVSGHLDIVQDELEGLKDLLRSDVYSLDHNTLLGLFNDSDILGPYGLHLPNEGNDKKGSELMTYQPIYDLSDIINDQNDLEADVNMSPSSILQTQQQQQPKQECGSVLNTPYHE
ncbi:heat shock factor protein isoform X3 [Lucilia cuprina]|uniref:heat shock factor protein isoform X3 n=1 Tax=Lucilia cuprina TaxID=7375 RepID=UPI001F063E80|nr:heat shock factor protein isoform X3 [Lucilia cuprina]